MVSLRTFIALVVILTTISEYSSLEIRGIVDKVVPARVQCLFRGKSSDYSRENCKKDSDVDVEESRKEHGSLDFFGRDLIKKITKKSDDDDDIENNEITISNATTGLDCNKTTFGGVVDTFKNKVKAIYPGTKWCGDGNVSDSYGDLGKFWATDSCCREHDLCPENIAADKIKYGLMNTGLFTRSHCECDRKFYNCLKDIGSFTSKGIGVTYFTVLGPQCFEEDYPVVACERKENRKCVQYRKDTRQAKKFQWFDSPTF